MNLVFILLALQIANIKVHAECNLSPCDVLEIFSTGHRPGQPINTGCTSDLHWRKLERRLQAIEQPVWTISFGQSRWRQCTKGMCRCDVSHRSLKCWRAGLTTLSPELIVPADLYTIDLGTNKLRTLHKTTFKGMRSLTELDMFDNHVEFLPSGIFDSLVNLRILRLQQNYLEEIDSEAFRYTKKLFHVDLSNNFLYTLPERLFANNSYLETIDISNNQIVYIPSYTFVGLKSLLILDLSKNKILQIENGTFLLTSLQILKLSDNKISNITDNAFESLFSLETLLLDKNNLQNIPVNLFCNLNCLTFLDLSNNHIISLTGLEFQNLRQLRNLDLKGNFISYIPDNIFNNCTDLEKLDLSKNKLRFLNISAFHGLKNLTSLILSDNQIYEVHSKTFATLKNLTTFLDLKIWADGLSRMDLDSLFQSTAAWTEKEFCRNLVLLLGISSIEAMQDLRERVGIGSKPKRERRYLDSNMFPSLPSRTLDYMPKLANVKLSNNPWHCDCHALYISAWVRLNEMKIWDYLPTCVSPWYLEGHFLKKLKFPELCSGQWASMVNLSPRLPMQQLLSLNVSMNRKPQGSIEHVNDDIDEWK